MQKLWSIIRHNRGVAVAAVIVILLLIWLLGCESTVKSLTDPDLRINRDQLQLELKTEISKLTQQTEYLRLEAQLRSDKLDQQDEIKRELFNLGKIVAEGNTINPIGIVTTLGSILGLGAIVDNRIKDVKIKSQKTNG